jgi:hypothetical protein
VPQPDSCTAAKITIAGSEPNLVLQQLRDHLAIIVYWVRDGGHCVRAVY